jgi:hypothetical protein
VEGHATQVIEAPGIVETGQRDKFTLSDPQTGCHCSLVDVAQLRRERVLTRSVEMKPKKILESPWWKFPQGLSMSAGPVAGVQSLSMPQAG